MTDVHERVREFWDRDSRTYDRTKSHAVSDPLEAAAWRAALVTSLPGPGARVLDVGAGTGALALLAAELGYRVTALDLSPGMLGEARRKAKARGLEVDFVVGPGTEPPPGPFDVVMQRHLLWTLPDPVGALRAWRDVAPGGRLVLFEGVWGRGGALERARDLAAGAVRWMYGVPCDHHAPYPEDVLAELPLARLPSPVPLIEAVEAAGWRNVRVRRLRDVEWAQRLHRGPLLGRLEHRPRYAIGADA